MFEIFFKVLGFEDVATACENVVAHQAEFFCRLPFHIGVGHFSFAQIFIFVFAFIDGVVVVIRIFIIHRGVVVDGFRLFDVTVDELKAYENQLKRIFKKMIANDLAFELNSKSMYLYHHEGLYRYVLALVKDLGCRKYSIGSDGHKLEHFRLNFDKIQELLREFEITEDMII